MEEDVRLPNAERLGGPHPDPQHGSLKLHQELSKSTPLHRADQASSPFTRLPRTVIEHILYVADANSFASLALLNRKWRRISDSTLLYAHHLSQCPSFALTQKATEEPAHAGDLALLKQQFGAQVRRNAFDAFLRPRKTLIKLTSTSMSSSTAFPRGEAFRFSFSPNAQLILCISSSRIVVLDITSDPAAVKHELKTWRRPLHAAIVDDGSLLAVVSSSHRVNIYHLTNDEARHIQDLTLNDIPRTLALSPTGGVLAIAYDDRVEVYAIGEEVLATERRAVRCSGVDSVSFSSDGVMLLGTSADRGNGGLVTITVPFYTESEAEYSPRDAQIRMWTTQILFPDVTTGFSHACLLPLHAEGEGSWILGFDEQMATFRAFGVHNTNSGTTYFVTPMSDDGSRESSPIMLPTVDDQGELVALGFENSGLWVYGVPDRLDIAPVAPSARSYFGMEVEQGPLIVEATAARDSLSRLQQSVTKPKVLINGHRMSDMPGMTAARWVRHPSCMADHRRLVAVAPGGISPPTIGEEDVPVDGGRVLLLDFTRSARNGDLTELNIEIGDAEPKMLSEPNSSLDTEVELERRRTRLHRGNAASPRARAFARESYPSANTASYAPRPNVRRNSSFFSGSSNGDIQHIPESPYDNTQPRSRDTLRRAATAAATGRGRYNPRYQDEARPVQDQRPVQAFQVPHESDADNWVPPPPPYSSVPDAPLPDYLRRTLLPSNTEPVHRVGDAPTDVRRPQTSRLERMVDETLPRTSLQRLHTITGSRLASRMRRSMRDSESEPSEHNRRHTTFFRRRGSATGSPPNLQEPNGLQMPLPEQHPSVSSQSQPQPLNGSTQPNQTQSAQRTNHQDVLLEESVDWQESIPANQHVTFNLDNYPYSISSPNLQVSAFQYDAPEAVQGSQHRPNYHRTIDRRSQSQDVRLPPGGIPPLNRRASTDPTLSTSSQVAAHELWRRRIEEWNEQTIYERSKRRSKCIVM
ncbi:F-box domain protein [Aspergillus sclerotioniger CBS 115572]|uniref:F-box domain protein n=1 Tax=Aspergillus sclerotioniger CBS 115572 TaxID=1450535 RepID=A0A317VJX1_9EURO|nr:F-box domain protein [Aspergillus sclerotioniger CBS 115572]PWY73759.1 F-box domain protein [Aspergillus sclerotioniger CBS 115572]